MRVLMSNYEFPPLGGGAGQMTCELARRLAGDGAEVDVLTMGSPGLPARERMFGITVYRVPTSRRDRHTCTLPEASQYLAGAMARIGALASERRYDLAHAHFVFPDGVLAMRLARTHGLPYVITAHGTDVPGHNPHRVRLLHKALAPLWRRVTGGAGTVVCPSAVLAEKVRRANPRTQLDVIPNAFDADGFHPAERRRGVLAVSRMIELKGLQYLLQGLHRLGSDVDTVLVGDGPYAAELRKLADSLRLPVRFTGWLQRDSRELARLYETSGMFVFPSEAENCPLVLLEAMAAGLPIITSTDRGCSDVVGDTALLVPPRNAGAIADAMAQLLASPELRSRLGAAARRRVVEKFGWDGVVARYREVYRRHAG
jgi:glycosyltransferase involved in cell wall biosynthesis